MVSVSGKHSGQSSKDLLDADEWLASLKGRYSVEGVAVITAACELARKAHAGQCRVSGEPYFQHVLTVANILDGVRMDYETLAAALLHDVVEDADITLDDIRKQFGNNIAGMVDGVTKMVLIQGFQGLNDSAKQERKNLEQAESLRKMLLAMVDDVRVVLIKLADRTHNMRTLSALPEQKQRRIAQETLQIYAPLANRLGMWQIKWELEDLAFRYMEPVLYKRIANMLDERRVDREQFIQDFIDLLSGEVAKAGVKATITGRPKHIYSIYRKMKKKNLDYHQIYDTRGVRVLVDSIPDCYTVLGIAHSLWRYIPGEFDDYIATPKGNNYQSIHTAVFGSEGKVVEVQVRTHKMHEDNELGVAAHWRYKEGAAQDSSFDEKIAWLRQLLEWKDEVSDASEFVEQFKSETFESRVYVFTPKGNVVDLVAGATPLDFAYHIHTEVGHRCRGAKVNGSIVPLTYVLNTGEQVEILTIKNGEPSRDWLNADLGYLKGNRARNKVQHWFNLLDHDRNVVAGRALLDKELQRLNLPDVNYEKIARELGYVKLDELCVAVARNEAKLSRIVKIVQKQYEADGGDDDLIRPKKESQRSASSDVTILGVGDLLTQLANCCKPLPGDAVMGYITKGRGISIHRKDCPHILRYSTQSPERLVEVAWGEDTEQVYPVDILVKAFDRQGLLRDVSAVLTNMAVNVIGVNTLSDKKHHMARMTLTVEISDLTILSKLLSKINSLPNVVEVKRKKR